MSTNDIDSDTEAPPQKYDNKTQGGRLRNAILDFGEELEEYCVEKDLLIAESLIYQDMYGFLKSVLDNSD